MAKETVTYKEPKSYFSANMRKAAEQWEKEQKQKTQKASNANKNKK